MPLTFRLFPAALLTTLFTTTVAGCAGADAP